MLRLLAPYLTILLLAGRAMAALYVVTPTGSGDYVTIQAAINAADHGDVIELTDGVFAGPGNIDLDPVGKRITIRSQNGPTACIIDGHHLDRAFRIHKNESRESMIEGIGFVSCYGDEGAAMLIFAASPLVRNCIFESCAVAVNGGAVSIHGGAPRFEECRFLECTSLGRGGALFCCDDSAPVLSNCQFSGCRAELPGGALYISYSPVNLTGCIFSENTGSLGGAIALNNYWLTVTRCTFIQNSAGGGSAIWAGGKAAAPLIVNCTLVRNRSSVNNGAIYLNGGSCGYLENTIIAYSTGMPVHCTEEGELVSFTACNLFSNSSGDWIASYADQFERNGNIRSDPLLDFESLPELYIAPESPCAPHPDGSQTANLIGAWPVRQTDKTR
ncbi:MAG: hypothetical protein GY835_11050 [bacterium]|nr:hypothetical protein [bacterium]